MTRARTRGRCLSAACMALAAPLALFGTACGRRGQDAPKAARAAIVAPGRALLPVVPPPTEGLEPPAREIVRDRERRLEASLAGPGPELAAAYGELGKAYQAFELHEPAASCYENARRLAPGTFAWPYLLGRALVSLERRAEAAAALEQALAVEPTSLPALVSLGEVQTAAGHMEAARAAYERALRSSPTSAPVLFALGRIAFLTGDAREAIRHLERAVAAEPGPGRAHYILALAYRQVGDLPKSAAHLAQRGDSVPMVADPLWDEVSEINPRNYAARALQALRSGNMARAVALMRAESAALPQDVEVRIQLGLTLSSAGAHREAVAEYREALRLQPGNARALYHLGTALLALGRNEEAAATLRQALEKSPESPRALLALARALRQLGRHGEARDPLGEAVRLDPTNLEARVEEGRLLARLGQCGEAAARLEKGLDVFPANASLTGLLARVLAACPGGAATDRARALRLARDAFASAENAENAATVAFVMAAAGRWGEAAAWQRKAVGLLPPGSPPRQEQALREQLRAIEARQTELTPF